MPHYLLSGHLPDNFDPSKQDAALVRNINDLNDEMEAAGARVVAAGLSGASEAKSVRLQNGEVMVTDGPYMEAKEHVGGLLILEAADMEEALMWAKKSVAACRMPTEVREIPYSNLPKGTPHPSRVKNA